jgi:Rho-binding antiterminator
MNLCIRIIKLKYLLAINEPPAAQRQLAEPFGPNLAFRDMETDYRPIDCGFYDLLEAAATRRQYARLQFFNELREYFTVNAVVKDLQTEQHEEFMLLATGEKVRLDRLVSIDGVVNPLHAHPQASSCSLP